MKLFFASIIALTLFLSCLPNAAQDKAKEHFKKDLLGRINKLRSEGCHCGSVYMPPAPPLTWNDLLEKAANEHAGDMFVRQYFSHMSKEGLSPKDRVVDAGYGLKGYKGYMVGENIAQGQMSVAEVMDGWIKSPEHCRNLMTAGFKEVGVARAGNYWVQDFGMRTPFSAREKRSSKADASELSPKNTQAINGLIVVLFLSEI